MDGQFGSLAFIATQSDVIERVEAIRSLSLPEGSTLRECATARNAYTARRLASDFKAGLREMARDAGEGASGGERLAEKHTLPVFTVSSIEYQKLMGLRESDGKARVWKDVEDTQLPPLIRHVQRQALVRRKALSKRRCEAVNDFATSLLSLLQHETRLPQGVRDAAKAAFEAEASKLKVLLERHTQSAEASISKAFEEDVAPKLKEGAGQAKADALATAQQWGLSVNTGGLHWATYKATTRRLGVFRLNMNEALCEPIFKSVATQWERSFISGLSTTLDGLQKQVEAALQAFRPSLLKALKAAEVPESAAAALGGTASAGAGLPNSLRSVVSDIKESAQKQQRDLSRSMEPTVQTAMTPGYMDATAEAGTGSHRRRVAKLEKYVADEAPKMFKQATDGVTGKMSEIASSIGTTLRKDVVHASQASLRTAYCPLWDELGDSSLRARRALAPGVQEVLLETRNAVRRLVEGSDGKGGGGRGGASGGGGAGSGGGGAGEEDDEEIVDVTEVERQAKRARQQAEAIELDDEPLTAEELAENSWPQAGAGGGSGKEKVKAE